MRWKTAAFISSSSLLIVILWLFTSRHFGFRLQAFDSTTFLTQVQQLKQLVTVRYHMQRVVGMREPKLPVGEESILLIVEGEVDAGLDLSKITPDDIAVGNDRSVTLTFPAAQIVAAFIDEKGTRVWDRRITWWTPWVPYNPDLEHRARLEAIADLRKAALDGHILDEARKSAETALRDFCNAVGLKARFRSRSLD
jgi:hypothetical protein